MIDIVQLLDIEENNTKKKCKRNLTNLCEIHAHLFCPSFDAIFQFYSENSFLFISFKRKIEITIETFLPIFQP